MFAGIADPDQRGDACHVFQCLAHAPDRLQQPAIERDDDRTSLVLNCLRGRERGNPAHLDVVLATTEGRGRDRPAECDEE